MIYKRGKNWHMDVMVNGERYREALHTTDRREALAIEKKRVAEFQQGKTHSAADRDFARSPFHEAATAFVEERVGHVAPRTIQFEKERLKPLAEFFGNKHLMKIRAEDLRAYQRQRQQKGLSSKTINMEVGVLRLLMKRAKIWHLVADEVKLFPKNAQVVGKVLTSEEKARLFQVASSKPAWLTAFCAAVIAVSTTCRGVELKNLRWRDVDVFNQILLVRRSKTAAGLRSIPLNRDAVLAFAKLKERAEALGSAEADHFVFPACERNKIDPSKPQKGWRSAWRSLTKEAGFPGFRFHDLRHQAITEMAEAGASDATIMAVAGHIDRAMMEHYSHVRMAAKRDVLTKLESGLMEIPVAEHRQKNGAPSQPKKPQ
ncbi:MAG: site-specific integrase [Acidobacteria bacterium]|nr:site-specific integrase [Acidobacteriota bacterium]